MDIQMDTLGKTSKPRGRHRAVEPVENERTDILFEQILSLSSKDECYAFFKDLCTHRELLDMGQRFLVARLLKNNEYYSKIIQETGASTATISRVSKAIKNGEGGYEMAFKPQKN